MPIPCCAPQRGARNSRRVSLASPAVFVHQSQIVSNGFRYLKDGEAVCFEPLKTDRGVSATKVSGPGGAPLIRPEAK